MNYKLPLGKLFGIRLFVHWTFSLLLLYIVFSGVRSGSDAMGIMWSVLFILSVFGCVVLHELGHALAARRYGIGTRDITLLPIGGVARLEAMPEKPSEELAVALAGPMVNVAIALLALPFVHLSAESAEIEAISAVGPSNFLLMFFGVNITLVLFNLLPAFPMDGGRVLRALLAMRLDRPKATRIAARVGQACAIGFVGIGLFHNPFLILIGVFIFFGARSEAEFVSTRSILSGYTVEDVMLRDFGRIPANENAGFAVRALLHGQFRTFLVTEGDAPVGVLTRDGLIKGLSESGQQTPVRSIMHTQFSILRARMPLEEAYAVMQHSRSELLPVVSNGRMVGALDAENIAEFILVLGAMDGRKG